MREYRIDSEKYRGQSGGRFKSFKSFQFYTDKVTEYNDFDELLKGEYYFRIMEQYHVVKSAQFQILWQNRGKIFMNPRPRSADEIFFICGRLLGRRIQERSFADFNVYIVVFFFMYRRFFTLLSMYYVISQFYIF